MASARLRLRLSEPLHPIDGAGDHRDRLFLRHEQVPAGCAGITGAKGDSTGQPAGTHAFAGFRSAECPCDHHRVL